MALLRRTLGIALVTASSAAVGWCESPSAPAVTMPEYRVDTTGFNAREDDIRAVLDSAGRELWRHFPDHRIEPFVVVRGESGPITLFERNERREIVIQLHTDGMFWSQYAYQFAHEFCHVVCGARPGDRSNLWFEETLCELASLAVMRGMARTWRTDPPYPNWRDYRDSLRDYADDAIRRRPHVDEIVRLGLPVFYRRHEAQLRGNPVDRDMNGSIAVVLLGAFEARPERWEAVRWLNTGKTEATRSFDGYLGDWHAAVPERHRAFVEDVAALFGRRLTVDPPPAP